MLFSFGTFLCMTRNDIVNKVNSLMEQGFEIPADKLKPEATLFDDLGLDRRALANRQLRFEQMIDRLRWTEFSAEKCGDRSFRPGIVPSDERDRGFIDEVGAGKVAFEPVPKFERLRLTGPGKETRHPLNKSNE